DIKKKLGYRFALQSGTFSNEAQPGQTVSVNLSLANEGYAAPFNPRGVEVVLRHTGSGQKWFASLPDDPRFWLGNGASQNLAHTLCLPAGLPFDTYDLLLNLPDPEASIFDRSEFAIRFASTLPGGADVWETATGYNKLGHSIAINCTASGAACAGQVSFSPASDFQGCVSNLVVSGTVAGGGYKSDGELTASTATVANGSAVLFTSDTGILLGANFAVEAGAYFEAKIEACQN
ncbi:MAG: DUF4832 domain-containing protein, partial [Bacteroidota bacterium]